MPSGKTPKSMHVRPHTVTTVNIVGQDTCPAYGTKCGEYGKDNHFKMVCKIIMRTDGELAD